VGSRPIEDVLARHTPQWLALEGVTGTALGQREGQLCLLVFVAKGAEAPREKIPPVVEGYRVVLEEAGPFRALGPGSSSPP
jgi:hypothetical protein